MAFLGNRSVNLLNLHYGMHSLAVSGGGAFFAVYLLKAGVSLPLVFCAFAAILGGRFCLRPIILIFGKAWGLRPVVMLGTLVQALQYPLLARVHGLDGWLLALCIVSAAGDTLYWTTYHAYFAALGDAEHRGHQVSAREALVSAVSIVGPILGGWGITHLGPIAAFGGVAIVQAIAALPLLASPNVAIAKTAPGAIWASRMGFAICVTDGWVSAGYYVGWQLFLFLTLKESFTAYGGALALAGVVGAIFGLILGKLVDLGHGAKAATLAFAVFAAYTIARSLTVTIPMALILNAIGALAGSLYVPPMSTAVYNLAKASPCPLRFHMVTEGAYDIGSGLGCLVAAGLIAAGVPLRVTLLTSVLGALGTLFFLRRYYASEDQSALSASQSADLIS